jgi:outer membrane receptor protein involved in Fe transport
MANVFFSSVRAMRAPSLFPRQALAAVAALLSTLVPTPGLAQEPVAPLQGIVVDEAAWTPVGAATLTLVGSSVRTQSLANGTFAFATAPLGKVSVRVDAPGYTSIVQEVEIRSGRVAFVQFALPSVHAVLDEILVVGSRSEAPPGLSEPKTAADLLAGKIPGVLSNPGEVGREATRMRLRGVRSITQMNQPAVFLDGVRLSGGLGEALSRLRQIPASQVRDIQVLRGPAAAFLYGGGADGVIRVWTKSGPPRE